MKGYLLLIFLGILLASCNGSKDKNSSIKPTSSSREEADLGDLYQYYHANPENLEQREENQIIDYAADRNMSAIRTVNGIYIHNKSEGSGDSIKWGDMITVHYKGYFLDGKEFDSSYGRGEPITFRVGNMVAGWNEALPFLKIGSKATLMIPSHMGYGKKGFPGFVGPDKILLFDMDILINGNENN